MAGLRGPRDPDQAARRLARIQLEELDDFETVLRHAEHLRRISVKDLPSVAKQLDELASVRDRLKSTIGGTLRPRERPKVRWQRWDPDRPKSLIAIDETGLTRGSQPEFPWFAVSAVIIRYEDLDLVGQEVRAWQSRWSDPPRYAHEMDVRKGDGRFHFEGDRAKQEEARASLRTLLEVLPWRGVAIVVDKDRFEQQHPDGYVDSYLPDRLYPLTVHMLFERLVHMLNHDDDRIGVIEAEGIGHKEDALLQQAFANLKLRGTRFISERWFRYQLGDNVSFHGKAANRPGLQLADWIVRACAQAVARGTALTMGLPPPAEHPWWEPIRTRLYDGGQRRADTFGLKVYPSAPEALRLVVFPGLELDAEVDWSPRKLKGPADSSGDP